VKFIVKIFVLLIFVALTSAGVVLAETCSYPPADCEPCYQYQRLCHANPSYICNAPIGYDCSSIHNVTYCYDKFIGCPGQPTPTGGFTQCGPGFFGCNVNSQPGFCCPVGGNPTAAPTSRPGCTPNCSGSYCGPNQANGCGGYCTCNECNSTPSCGQTLDCGGTAPSTNAGVPVQMTIVSPNGTDVSPTLLDDKTPHLLWDRSTSGKTDRYLVQYLDSAGVGATIYISGIGKTGTDITGCLTAGINYHWRIRAENTDCGVQSGPWSTWGYFKINTPPTVAIVSPNGTAAIPTIVIVISNGIAASSTIVARTYPPDSDHCKEQSLPWNRLKQLLYLAAPN
jgi:hypothetical protein